VEFIFEPEKSKGKTIDRSIFVDNGGVLAIIFTDKTSMFIAACYQGDFCNLELLDCDKVRNPMLRDSGIVTDEEFQKLEKEQAEWFEAWKRDNELRTLELLRKKYG